MNYAQELDILNLMKEIDLLKTTCNKMSDNYMKCMLYFLTEHASCPHVIVSTMLGQITQIVTGMAINVIPDLMGTSEQEVLKCIEQMNIESLRAIKENFKKITEESKNAPIH